MVKLKDLIDKCIQDDSEKLINFTRFLKECTAKTSNEGIMLFYVLSMSYYSPTVRMVAVHLVCNGVAFVSVYS